MMNKQDGVIVGDDTPDNYKQGNEEIVDVQQQGQEPIADNAQPESKQEEKIYAGKFKSADDLEKSYAELQGKLGEQGNKIGKYEQEKSVLLSQLEQMQAKSATGGQPQEEDLSSKLLSISKAVEEGDLSISEGMMQTAQITSQIAQENTLRSIEQRQREQIVNNSKSKFAGENADFFDMQQSGALEDIKAQLPEFHDDVSAYYAKKAMDSQSALEAAVAAARTEGFEAGKAEMAKIADGDKNTRKVLQSPGEKAKDIGSKPPGKYTQTEMRSSGLEALQRARGG